MMTWRDQLQPGTFRSAAFRTSSADLTGGRRVVQHDYPLQDEPWPEDLGVTARGYQLNLYVIGPDYMAARDQLLEALEQRGPGTLVHPYLGTLRVQVTEFRMTESTREGGMARFSVTAVRAGENRFPAQSTDTAAVVADRSESATSAVEESFAEVFSVAGQPQYVSDAAVNLLNKVTGRLQDLAGAFPSAPTALSNFVRSLSGTSGALTSLIQQPLVLAGEITGLIGSLGGLVTQPFDALGLYSSLFDFGDDLPAVTGTTSAQQAQADNQAAVVSLVQQSAVVSATATAAALTFDSQDEALAVRDELADELDAQMTTADDSTYAALTDLRVALVEDINTRGANLARLVTYRPAATLPALVIAQRIYGDATQDADLVARNGIRHPGFVPGGAALQVLSRV